MQRSDELLAVRDREHTLQFSRDDWAFRFTSGWELEVRIEAGRFLEVEAMTTPDHFRIALVEFDDRPMMALRGWPPGPVEWEVFGVGVAPVGLNPAAMLAARGVRIRVWDDGKAWKEWRPLDASELSLAVTMLGGDCRLVSLRGQFEDFIAGGLAPLTTTHEQYAVFEKFGEVLDERRRFSVEFSLVGQ